MGNRATITTAPFDRKNAAIYVHWNGGRASIEAFCKAAKELGYRSPGSDPSYAMARLTGLICTYSGLESDTSVGVGTVGDLIEAGDDNGCWVLGGDWEIKERRNTTGRVATISDTLEYDVDITAAEIVAQVRRAAAAASKIDMDNLTNFTDTGDVTDAAIEAVRNLIGGSALVDGYKPSEVRADCAKGMAVDSAIILAARLIQQQHPDLLVDPVDAIVREELAAVFERRYGPTFDGTVYRDGSADGTPLHEAAKRLYLLGIEKGKGA